MPILIDIGLVLLLFGGAILLGSVGLALFKELKKDKEDK
jgi:hypothetical protein